MMDLYVDGSTTRCCLVSKYQHRRLPLSWQTGKIIPFAQKCTSNVGEYQAAITALEGLYMTGLALIEVRILSDSQLLVRQLSGQYAVKSERIAVLHKEILELVSLLKKKRSLKIKFEWVPREENLAGLVLDGEEV